MSNSLLALSEMGCNRIILACNTSHLFLPYIFQKHPEIEMLIQNIIDACVSNIVNKGCNTVYLLASEGTIESQIYQKKLEEKNIKCICPSREEYDSLRVCIEAVKQNNFTELSLKHFTDLINRYDNCILGCTELPVLLKKYNDKVFCKNIYDPLDITLLEIFKEYSQ